MATSSKKVPKRIQNKNGLSFVKNIRDLKNLIKDGYYEYRIALGGTAGAMYSRKTITLTTTKKFHIINHIDDTTQVLTQKQLFLASFTYIGKGLRNNCLIVDLKQKYEED